MSYWVELHCDVALKDRAPSCRSRQRDCPGGMVSYGGTVKRVTKGLQEIAKQQGWRRYSEGWVCDQCLEFRKEMKG